MLELSQLAQLLAGKPDSTLWICNMPERARVALGCSTGAVYLSQYSAKHILDKHGDIDTYKILLLPIAIQQGTLLREKTRRQLFVAIYKDRDDRSFLVAMKTADKGHQLWVSSMHRINEAQERKQHKICDPL